MNDIKIKLLTTDEEKYQFFRLRHRVFTIEKGWVKSNEIETDEFDQNAFFLGVLYKGELVAGTRIIYHQYPWMFDTVFSNLLSEPIKKEPHSVEMTRYFVAPEFRKKQKINGESILFSQLLQQAFYTFATLNGVSKAYCVFEYRVYYLFRMQNLPAENLNESIDIGDNLETPIPVLIKYEKVNREKFLTRDLSEVASVDFLKN